MNKSGSGSGRGLGCPKTGGRTKGTPNKRRPPGVPRPSDKQARPLVEGAKGAAETLESLGFNGLAEMWRMWKDPLSSENTRTRMLVEMTQYQFPKRKAVEMSGNIGITAQLIIKTTGA